MSNGSRVSVLRSRAMLLFVLAMITATVPIISVTPASAARAPGAVVLYEFTEEGGSTVNDTGTGAPLNLTIANPANVTWQTGRGLTVDSRTIIASSGPATKVHDAITASGAMTVEAWVTPANTSQSGPARIVTMSTNSNNRNFTLGQSGDTYGQRVRTTTTGNNGWPTSYTPAGTLDTSPTHVVFTRDAAGASVFYIDGVSVATPTISGNLSNWNSSYALGLADEFNINRSWLGEYCLVAIYDKILTPGEVSGNFAAGCDATPAPPSAPANLVATGGNNTVNLTWTANSEPDLDGYNVYRSTSASVVVDPGNKINATLVATNAYADTTAVNGTEYFYVVTAVDTVPLESGASNEDSATPSAVPSPPAAPANLTATGGDAVVDLAWDANGEPDLAGYNVYRSTSASVVVDPGNKINTTLVATNAYSDTTAVNGTEYFYVVTAEDLDGSESGASNEDSATPSDSGPAPLFAAYNDFGWAAGQLEGNTTHFTSPNGGSGQLTTGDLVNFADGGDTGVDLTVVGGAYNGTSHAQQHPTGQSGEPASGTDAFDVFDGKLTALGSLSYESSPALPPPDGNLVVTLDSLDPSHDYEIVFYAHRDNYTLDQRASLVTISGALDFTNESTTGSDFSGPTDDSTRMPPDNDSGWVSRWTNVHPGSDGVVELTITYDGDPSAEPGDQYKGKYANAFALFDEGMVRTGETVSFAAMGDYGGNNASEQAVADLIDAKNVDIIITTGDNSYNPSTIDDNIGQYYADYIGAYSGAYGTGATTNMFFPSAGNHDYTDGPGIATYLSYFALPGAGIPGSGTSGSELYYDFVQGPVHFFVVDSTPSSQGGSDAQRDPTSPQGVWLQNQLAASTAQWKVVYFHHPPYSSATPHGTIEDDNFPGSMKWPYEAWGADAVFSGHDHTYERIMKDGNTDGVFMPYFVTGAGGRSLYAFNPTSEPGSASRYNSDYGSMIVTADDDDITFEFWSIASGGTLIDSYTIGSTTPPTPPDDWVAYNDMNTSAGAANPANVTSYTYAASGALKDFATGAVLPVTITGSTLNGYDPTPNGGPVTNTTSDAYAAFTGIVDLSGGDELDAADWDSIVTIDNLDPAKRYAITLSANRDNAPYADNRYARVTIGGADASTAASSPGVVLNSADSVSFSVGDNSANGYVAKWVDIDPGADGTITILSEWDDSLGTVAAGTAPNIKGYSMSAVKLETYIPSVPAPDNWTAYNDTAFSSGQLDTNITVFSSPNGGNPYPSAGELVDYGTGGLTGAMLNITGGSYNASPSNQANHGYTSMVGEADVVFNGIIDPKSTMSYIDGVTDNLVFDFSGLDPTRTYTFVHYANRGDQGGAPYAWDRGALATISDTDGFVNNSTVGTDNNGADTFTDGADPSTRYSADNSTGSDPADGWIVRFDDIVPGPDGDFTVIMSFDGEAGSEYKGKYSNAVMLQEFGADPEPTEWMAYNDLNVTDGSNAANVTGYEYDDAASPLTDFTTGLPLPVTVTGSFTGTYFAPSNGADVSNPWSDAFGTFDGILNLAGVHEIGDATWDNTVTFDNLDSTKRYAITLTGNRDNYPGERYGMVNLLGVDASINASSSGVVANSPTSVSFSVGDNAIGHVAKWVDIDPGADGTFSVESMWDDGFAGSKGYAMSAYKIETYTPTPPPTPPENWTAYNDTGYAGTQIRTNITGFTSPNGDAPLFSSGELVDYASGIGTGATVTITGGNYTVGNGAQGSSSMVGEANAVFNGIIDPLGTVSYDGNSLVFTFEGLDETKAYDFVHYANRNDTNPPQYGWTRAALATISDADGFVNNSTVGVDNNTDPTFTDGADPSTRYSADNSTGGETAAGDGWIVRFDDVRPGPDGDFTVTMSFDGTGTIQGKYSNAVMLDEKDAPPPPTPENWTAYNDTGPVTGQLDTKITTFTSPVGGSGFDATGELIDYATGLGTEAFLTITGGSYDGDSGGQGGQGSTTMVGDADAVFNGIVDPLGTVSYLDNDLVFTFTGLDATKEYSVVHYANRNDTNPPQYGWGRAALATISDVDGFINNSTIGEDSNDLPVFDSAQDPTTRYSADNSTGTETAAGDGWVVRFDNIQPGSDGDFTLTMFFDGDTGTIQGKYTNALMLGESDSGPALGLWTAYNDLAWGTGQRQSMITHVTSPTGGSGLPSSGELVDYGTGLPTGVDLAVTGGEFTTANASQGADATTGDAFAIFDGIVSTEGAISYVESASPTGDLVLTLTGMDPTHVYDIVYHGHRNNYTWAQRSSLVTISSADGFMNESSVGADDMLSPLFGGPGDTSTRLPADNDAGYVARFGHVDPGSDGEVVLTITYDGDPAAGAEFKGKYASSLALTDEGAPTPPPAEPTNWVVYNDLNTMGGPPATNVTGYGYDDVGAALVDHGTGTILPVTATGSWLNGLDPVPTGANPAAFTDAHDAFSGFLNLAGNLELDAADWDNTVTFDNLDPDKRYAITLTGNRDNYPGLRFAEVSIADVVDSTNASSAGVVVNSPTSVSFSVGDNTANGYVAKWVDIDPGLDGSFSVTSVWDTPGQPGTKGYAMSAYKLEGSSDTEAPSVLVDVPVHDSVVASPLTMSGSASDDVGVTRVRIAVFDQETFMWWDGSVWQSAWTSFDAPLSVPGGVATDWDFVFDPPSLSTQPYFAEFRVFDASGKSSFTTRNFALS